MLTCLITLALPVPFHARARVWYFFRNYSFRLSTNQRLKANQFTQNGWRWVVDARGNASHVVDSHELLSAFLELEATVL